MVQSLGIPKIRHLAGPFTSGHVACRWWLNSWCLPKSASREQPDQGGGRRLADHRNPVILVSAFVLACLAWILYGRPGVFPPAMVGIVTGMVSGAAMLPYTVIRKRILPR